jgi:IclR family transcriptional regulator, KDG regulon repressor
MVTLAPRGRSESDGNGTTVPAVSRALDLLEHLSHHPSGLTLSELSVALRLPKNTVSRILHTLQVRGYVDRDRVERTFNVTRKFFTLGQPFIGDVSLTAAASGPMRQLRDLTRETVQLGIRVGDEGVIIEKLEALQPLRIAVDIGLRFRLYNNAPGKVLLAYMPALERQATIERIELAAHTARTITDRQELCRECDRITAAGYATDYGEADEGIHCVAAPIFDHNSHLAATVWVSAPSRRLPRVLFPEMARHVAATAAHISGLIRPSC